MSCVLVLCDFSWGDVKKHAFTPVGSPTHPRRISSVLIIGDCDRVTDRKHFKIGKASFGL